MIKCTYCQQRGVVNLGLHPYCLAHAHAMIDKAAAFSEARRMEAERELATCITSAPRTHAPAPSAPMMAVVM